MTNYKPGDIVIDVDTGLKIKVIKYWPEKDLIEAVSPIWTSTHETTLFIRKCKVRHAEPEELI